MADFSGRIDGIARRMKCAGLYAEAQKAAYDNPPWESADFRVLILRLSPFRDASRSAGHLFLHRLVRDALGPGAFIDFAFFPSKSDRKELEAAEIPFITGAAAKRTADEYGAVLISCSYALELPNLPYLLKKSGIPLKAKERRAAPSPLGRAWPPLILGGSNAFASQALVFPDGDAFVDGIFFGEGEDGGAELIRSLAEGADRGAGERCLAAEGASAAFWAAGFGAPGKPRSDGSVRRVSMGRAKIGAGHPEPLLLDRYQLLNSEEASTCRLQISWGCPSFCSFCFEGWERKPYRELPREAVLRAAERIKAESGASAADLYSFNFNAHTDILSLILDLNRIFERVNMMSQRADLLVRVPGMIGCEIAAEKRSFTVGVEGISERMRAYYSKGLSGADLDALLLRLAREKIRELKLFFILSGTEDDGDFEDFRIFCARLKTIKETENPGLRTLFSFGYLVRMPFTPLRAEPLILDRETFRIVEATAKGIVEAAGFEFRLASDWSEYVADQLLVSGGHALAYGLERAAEAGCAFDLKVEGNLSAFLAAALREAGELTGGTGDGSGLSGPLVEAKTAGYAYPLDFAREADFGNYLEGRLESARSGIDGGSCLGDYHADGAGECLRCGACADGGERTFLTKHRVAGTAGDRLQREIEALIKEKRRMRAIYLSAELPERFAGAEKEFLDAILLKTILSAAPELSERLFRAEEALRSEAEWRSRLPAGFVGNCIVALYGVGLTRDDAEKAAEAIATEFGSPSAILEGLGPGDVSKLGIVVAFDRTPPEAALARARKWLAALKVAYTERKTASGRAFDIAPKDRKKRIVENAEIAGNLLTVEGGAKIDLSALFPRPEDAASATVKIAELRLGSGVSGQRK